MQAELRILCNGCSKCIGEASVDTADDADVIQARINKVILSHRQECRYYHQMKNEREQKGMPK